MDDQPSAKKAPLIGYFIWLVFVMIVLAIAAVVGPRMWQGASFAADSRATVKQPATSDDKAEAGAQKPPVARENPPK